MEERDFTEAIIYADNDSSAAQAVARRAVWTFHAILLLILGLLIWRAAGVAWAAGTLAFLAIEPTVGAHLPVVMTDLPVALALGIAVVAAGLAISTWQWRWMVVLGLAIGVTVGSKHSALPGLMGLGAVCLIAIFTSRTGVDRGLAHPTSPNRFRHGARLYDGLGAIRLPLSCRGGWQRRIQPQDVRKDRGPED